MSTRVIMPRHVRIPYGNTVTHVVDFIKNNVVMCIAFVAAIITSVIIPIDREYLSYIDFKTISWILTRTFRNVRNYWRRFIFISIMWWKS